MGMGVRTPTGRHREQQGRDMKQVIQTIMVVPISETIAKAFGRNTLLGTGAAIVTARFVLRSFPGMLALGALAGCLNYLQQKRENEAEQTPDRSPAPRTRAARHARPVAKG
jgi:hypothetical protein